MHPLSFSFHRPSLPNGYCPVLQRKDRTLQRFRKMNCLATCTEIMCLPCPGGNDTNLILAIEKKKQNCDMIIGNESDVANIDFEF